MPLNSVRQLADSVADDGREPEEEVALLLVLKAMLSAEA
jgi:hypothetical protein